MNKLQLIMMYDIGISDVDIAAIQYFKLLLSGTGLNYLTINRAILS